MHYNFLLLPNHKAVSKILSVLDRTAMGLYPQIAGYLWYNSYSARSRDIDFRPGRRRLLLILSLVIYAGLVEGSSVSMESVSTRLHKAANLVPRRMNISDTISTRR